MLHINEVREPAKQMAGVIVRASDHIAKAVGSIKKPREVAGMFDAVAQRYDVTNDVIEHYLRGLKIPAPKASQRRTRSR